MADHQHDAKEAPDDQVMALLGDIKSQNETMMQQFDTLEANISRRATMAGAMAGAFTGGVGGTVVSVGIELIKAKFGG
jgi:TRAP-type mannitol/chloroaromatic compound transport system permease large subunit